MAAATSSSSSSSSSVVWRNPLIDERTYYNSTACPMESKKNCPTGSGMLLLYCKLGERDLNYERKRQIKEGKKVELKGLKEEEETNTVQTPLVQ